MNKLSSKRSDLSQSSYRSSGTGARMLTCLSCFILGIATSSALYAQRPPTPKIGSNLDLTGFGLVFADDFNTLSAQAPDDKGSAIWLGHGPYGAASNFSVSQWSWDSKTLRVENGALVNTAWWDQSINNWRSGLISSMDRQRDGFAQRFGYWEARMRMPNAGRGAFPAFWLLAATTIPNHNGIKGYEIDILEWFGQDAPQSADRFAHTIHEWNPDGSQGAGSEGKWVDVADPINTWHTYGCMVTPWWIAFYLDGVCTWTKPVNLDYNKFPLYVMVNYALGGGWPVTGEPYASHGDSALLVDYVYAYAPPAAWPIPRAPTNLRAWVKSSGWTKRSLLGGKR
jgi:beta-glucanase (GH16 family)